MLAAILPLISGIFSGILSPVMGYFTSAKHVEAEEFTAMTVAQQQEALALIEAQTALNNAKMANNAHGGAAFMVYLFGLPAALHWSAVFLATTFPALGWTIPAAPPVYQDAELKIALSFFLLAPALPIVTSLAARLRG